MKVKFSALLCIMLLVFTGCKKDDPVEETATVTPKPQEPTSVEAITGKFIDAAVEGLSYATATQSGVTNENGEFKYVLGEEITFSVGDIVLGTTLGQEEITPITLAQEIDANATIASKMAQNIAAFLQTLDTDGDASNGISIAPSVATNTGVANIDFTAPIEGLLADIVLQVIKNIRVELRLVYPSEAANHMASSLGISYTAPENVVLTHLEPTLRAYYQTWQGNFISPSAVFKNTFDTQGNLMETAIFSKYSSKILERFVFTSHNASGLPLTGILTNYGANSLWGAFPQYEEVNTDIEFSYNEDDQLVGFSFLFESGLFRTTEFTAFDEENRPLSFFTDYAKDDPNRGSIVTWNLSYEEGLMTTADRIGAFTFNNDNGTSTTYTTRNYVYEYTEAGNIASLQYTRVFEDTYTRNTGESSFSRTEAAISEVFTYGNSNKLESWVQNSVDVFSSSGILHSSSITHFYDSDELIKAAEYSSSNGYSTNSIYEQGVVRSSVSYYNGLLEFETEYFADGGKINTNYYYDSNGALDIKEIFEYTTEGLQQKTIEYYEDGNVYFTVLEEYNGWALQLQTGFDENGIIIYRSYYDEDGKRTKYEFFNEGVLAGYYEYEYNANGYITRQVYKNADDEVVETGYYTYDSNGYIESIVFTDGDGTTIFAEYYEHDINGFLSKISGYRPNGNLSYIFYYEDGNLVREEYYDEDGNLEDVVDHTATSKRMAAAKTVNSRPAYLEGIDSSGFMAVDRLDTFANPQKESRSFKKSTEKQLDIKMIKANYTVLKRRMADRN